MDFPEHQVTLRAMITDYLPAVVQAYLSIPDQRNSRAVSDITGSFALLRAESDSIYYTIMENSLNRLKDHNRILHMQFGRLPFESEPRMERGDERTVGGADKQVGE